MAHNVRPAWRVTGFSTTYCYRVRTTAGGWLSTLSSTVSATTPAVCL